MKIKNLCDIAFIQNLNIREEIISFDEEEILIQKNQKPHKIILLNNDMILPRFNYYRLTICDQNEIKPKYLYYYLSSERAQRIMERFSIGPPSYRLDQSMIELIEVPVIPLKEQEILCNILSKIDQLITGERKLIKTQQKLQKGIAQRFFDGQYQRSFDG